MAKSPLEKQLEKNRAEAKRQAERARKDEQKRLRQERDLAQKAALRQRAALIVSGQEIIDGLRILDVNAETVLNCLIEHCMDPNTGLVRFEDSIFPIQMQLSLPLELEKLTQYGMINGSAKWMGGGSTTLLPAAFLYFDDKEVVMLKKEQGMLSSVENHFHGNTNVISGDVSSSTIIAGENNNASSSRKELPSELQKESLQKTNLLNSIFISHRSTDKAIADMLFDFLVGSGIPRDTVFCSSLPGNDVKEKISVEVKAALRSSAVNIAILSADYYNSIYCLNEAGVLWFLDDSIVIPVALPEITPDEMVGFLGDEYKIRRLDDTNDIAYILEQVSEKVLKLQIKPTVIAAETSKLIRRYNDYICSRRVTSCDPSTQNGFPKDLELTVEKYCLNDSDKKGYCEIEFEIIICNVSDKAVSVFGKELHFYKEGKEIYKFEVTRYEMQKREDALDSYMVLAPVNQIITLDSGRAESIGIIHDINCSDDFDKVVFTCKANQHEYELVVYEKKNN